MPPTLAPSDDHSAEREDAAAKEREDIAAADADRMWFDVKLQPWSEERQRLLDALAAADVPLPDPDVVDDHAFYHGRFTWAVKALYLASHTPKDWDPVRSRLQSVIDEWGCAEYVPAGIPRKDRQAYVSERLNVPGDNISEKATAVNFVFEMTNAYRKFVALRRVKRARGPDSGNSHSP